ncbi:MAG: hydroxymethylglutaryl-CoA lyase [Planktotalea sp.]|uniref:hydroxymethylglutaryl-CoA lyase n=1 Tax=Planktotalea sp. TaxID=2029877 RepID=UPI003C73790C
MSGFVEVFEVGPRDGLQNEKRLISAAEKIALVDLLSTAGFRRIEVASFVSPKWVPQMATSADVLGGIKRADGISYAALTPNMRGLEGAIMAKADEVAIFGSASEGFSKANINASIAESLERFRPVAEAAKGAGIPVRGYISCVVNCPYDGPTPPQSVAAVARELQAMGCYELSLGDTTGHAYPSEIKDMFRAVRDAVPDARLAGHYHDTSGRALENIEASLQEGVRVFDAAIGGLGGCPYAPGAAGNVATEAVHQRLRDLGYTTGLDAGILEQAAKMAQALRSAETTA